MFDLPDDDTLYQALLNRSPAYEGRAWVCVSSTGIFCRLTCPAPKPKRQNVHFRASPGECLAEGFRACKRCHPLQAAAQADPAVSGLLAALESRPDHRWSEDDVAALGHDPSTIRRAFRRHFGMTFLELARQRRLRHGFATLGEGGKVIDAQLEAGFDSPAAFRAAFARLLGLPPADLKGAGSLRADWIATPLGDMVAVSSAHALHLLEFVGRQALARELQRLAKGAKGDIGIGRFAPTEQVRAELAAYFAGQSANFQTPLALHGTPFYRQVWAELQRIPPGETRSYGELARAIGRPTAMRAVAQANGANQLALVIPCHRVIGADGSMTGYGGGLWRKQKLLEVERAYQRTTPPRP